MRLNRIEFFLMNSPIRRFIQNKREIKEFCRLSSLPKNKTILEIGCGNGSGTKLIQNYFSPQEIQAIDLDPRMIQRAKKRVQNHAVHFQIASATKLPFKNNSFDALFDFGIIHHIPDWENAIHEMYRVLKPEGEILLEDLSIESFRGFPGGFYRKILDHPYTKMYTHAQFIESMKENQFEIIHSKTYNLLGLIRYFVIIARKKE